MTIDRSEDPQQRSWRGVGASGRQAMQTRVRSFASGPLLILTTSNWGGVLQKERAR
jgi:hypothetical protein